MPALFWPMVAAGGVFTAGGYFSEKTGQAVDKLTVLTIAATVAYVVYKKVG
jgi:hypothetical protein